MKEQMEQLKRDAEATLDRINKCIDRLDKPGEPKKGDPTHYWIDELVDEPTPELRAALKDTEGFREHAENLGLGDEPDEPKETHTEADLLSADPPRADEESMADYLVKELSEPKRLECWAVTSNGHLLCYLPEKTDADDYVGNAGVSGLEITKLVEQPTEHEFRERLAEFLRYTPEAKCVDDLVAFVKQENMLGEDEKQ